MARTDFLGRPQNPRGYLYFPLTLTVQAQAGPSRGQNCPAGPGRPILFLTGPGRPGPGQKCFSRPFKALPGPPPKKFRCRATQCSCEPHFAPPSSPASHSFPLVFFAFDSTYHPLCLSQILTRFFCFAPVCQALFRSTPTLQMQPPWFYALPTSTSRKKSRDPFGTS